MTEQLSLTPNAEPYSLGDDTLADKCRLMLDALKKIGIFLSPKRVSVDEIELYYDQREASMTLCGDNPDPYLIEAWIVFESITENEKDYLYQQLQDLAIYDDYNYDFSEGDYEE